MRSDAFGFPITSFLPNVDVRGDFIVATSAGTTGTVDHFQGNVGSFSFIDVPGGKAPAKWFFGEFQGPCNLKTTEFVVNAGADNGLDCFLINVPTPATADPSNISNDWEGIVVTITGQGFDPTYGMPTVVYYDSNGNPAQQANASYVSPDGTIIQVVVPNLSQLQSGNYLVFIGNWDANSAWNMVGFTNINVYTPAPPPPPPPDPCGTRDDPCLIN